MEVTVDWLRNSTQRINVVCANKKQAVAEVGVVLYQRAGRQLQFWITFKSARNSSGMLKQEWTLLRGAFRFGTEIGVVSSVSLGRLGSAAAVSDGG